MYIYTQLHIFACVYKHTYIFLKSKGKKNTKITTTLALGPGGGWLVG